MLINEAARKCGITKKAVQYYVEQGLVDRKCWKMDIEIFQKRIRKY